jgi:hypothetical protein
MILPYISPFNYAPNPPPISSFVAGNIIINVRVVPDPTSWLIVPSLLLKEFAGSWSKV